MKETITCTPATICAVVSQIGPLFISIGCILVSVLVLLIGAGKMSHTLTVLGALPRFRFDF